MILSCLTKHADSQIAVTFTFEKEMEGIFIIVSTNSSHIVYEMVLKQVTFQIATIITNSGM